MLLRPLLFAVLFLFRITAICQDANYWSSNYNAGGFFTPGAVIAQNNDSGVLFLNPALLAYSKLNAVNVSGTIYQLEKFRIENAVGKGLHLRGGGTSVNPLLASNSYTFNKKRKPFTLFYALINTPVIDFSASQRKDDKFQVLDDSYSPGTEYFVGQYNYQNKITETGFILSSGTKLSKDWAIGITLEGTLHKQFLREDYSARSLMNGSTDPLFPLVVNATQYYQNSNVATGGRIRLGVSYSASEAHHFGLLVTSPMMHFSGSATIVSDITINNIMLGGVNVRLLGSTRQDKLKTKWKTPLSAGFGYSYHHSKGQLYFALEYFNKVKEYNVVLPRQEIFVRPDTAGAVSTPEILKLKDARKAICNVAVGASWVINPRFTGYVSMRTDFTYTDKSLFKDDSGFQANTSSWNNYHMQVGANLIRRKFSLRTGLMFTYGHTHQFEQPVDFDNPTEDNFLQGEPGNTKATHFLGSLMVSYIHNL